MTDAVGVGVVGVLLVVLGGALVLGSRRAGKVPRKRTGWGVGAHAAQTTREGDDRLPPDRPGRSSADD